MGSDERPSSHSGGSRGKAPGDSRQPLASSSSSSSSMSEFYKPMNPSFPSLETTAPTTLPYTPTLQHPTQVPPMAMAGSTHESTAAPGSALGPSAALLLANLAATPGFLSNQAIQQAREDFSQHQVNVLATPQTQGYQPTIQGYQYSPVPTYSPSHHQQGSVNYKSSDTNASIEALLKELHQTGVPNSSSSASYTPSTVTPLPPPVTTMMPVPLKHQPPESQAPEDYSNGKITPQLLKRLAAIAETDSQEGGTLLNEIKRLRERQVNDLKVHEQRQREGAPESITCC